MDILTKVIEYGNDDIAKVYVCRTKDGSFIECVESTQPPLLREEKWVLIVSVLKGCPVKCVFCDANIYYKGKLTYEEIMEQINFLIKTRYPSGKIPAKKFKIQFARMGEPAFNYEVLKVLKNLPTKIGSLHIMPSISTVAPKNFDDWFEQLLAIKKEFYNHSFQFQFSIHTTDEKLRNTLIPIKTWSFEKMAWFGKRFHTPNERKITLNFATPKGYPIDPVVLKKWFSPKHFAIKLTPLNPTVSAQENRTLSLITHYNDEENFKIINAFKKQGYDVILSIGELQENDIGSNCGMYVTKVIKQGYKHQQLEGYSFIYKSK